MFCCNGELRPDHVGLFFGFVKSAKKSVFGTSLSLLQVPEIRLWTTNLFARPSATARPGRMADEETNAVRVSGRSTGGENFVINSQVQASLYLFGNYEFTPAPQAAQITDRALTLNINCLGNRACSLVLSFKHIMRVDLLDNQESRGVGLWVYMNHYMADRIQRKFQLDPNTFLHLRLPFGLEYRSVCLVEFTSAFSFLVFDVQNAAPEIVDALRIVLRRAGEFRNDYLRRRFALKGQPSPPAPNMLGRCGFRPIHPHFSPPLQASSRTRSGADGWPLCTKTLKCLRWC